ncbi:MAG: 50S ribosomal protein L2 [Verrucomicrobiae bacterium]|nr:50S ribosomal protein L2 [Verrucomicrobiae bacterium]
MAVRTFRPLTPGQRFKTAYSFEEITKSKPEKSLTEAIRRTGGRNCYGRTTSRFMGGGHKRRYRIIDFKRDRKDEPATVESVEYDPNRTCRIALIKYPDGEKRYILSPEGLKVGQTVMSGENAPPEVGNALPLKKIPVGMEIHNIELYIGHGGQMVRSAGGSAMIASVDAGYANVKLPSGEVRMINGNCLATMGALGNSDHEKISLGKAGRKRYLGYRPHQRGVSMNPVDSPMGGGQGKSKSGGGRHHPVSPWGKLSKGKKTRSKYKYSDKYILQRRKGKLAAHSEAAASAQPAKTESES